MQHHFVAESIIKHTNLDDLAPDRISVRYITAYMLNEIYICIRAINIMPLSKMHTYRGDRDKTCIIFRFPAEF